MSGSSFDRQVPCTAAQIFDLVLDVERYGEFMPFGLEARVLAQGSASMRSVQHLRLGPFQMEFETQARYCRPEWIQVRSDDPVFRRFAIDWAFAAIAGSGCRVHAQVDCLPRSLLLTAFLTPWSGGFAAAMVRAFEKRAGDVYGLASH